MNAYVFISIALTRQNIDSDTIFLCFHQLYQQAACSKTVDDGICMSICVLIPVLSSSVVKALISFNLI